MCPFLPDWLLIHIFYFASKNIPVQMYQKSQKNNCTGNKLRQIPSPVEGETQIKGSLKFKLLVNVFLKIGDLSIKQ